MINWGSLCSFILTGVVLCHCRANGFRPMSMSLQSSNCPTSQRGRLPRHFVYTIVILMQHQIKQVAQVCMMHDALCQSHTSADRSCFHPGVRCVGQLVCNFGDIDLSKLIFEAVGGQELYHLQIRVHAALTMTDGAVEFTAYALGQQIGQTTVV